MTTVLGLTPLSASQSAKEVQINGNFALLEAFGYNVLGVTNTPPSTPSELDSYLVLGSPTGAWAGHSNTWAAWINSAWEFVDADSRFLFLSSADSNFYRWGSGKTQVDYVNSKAN
jgi:hypothetical protein